MTGLQLHVPGHERWLRIPLDPDPDRSAEQLVRSLVGDVASREFHDDTVAMVAGTSRLVQRESAALERQGVLVQLAWMLLPEPGLLLPGPVVTLRLRPLSPADSDDDVVAAACDLEAPRHGGVDVDVLTTPSGRALSVRYRPVVEVDDERRVDEHRVVLWPRREQATTLELSLYAVDLVEGGRAAEPLLELARSVQWSTA